jgi:hypothetical protein
VTARTQYLAELTVYDIDGATTATLRYCTGRGFVTTPSETPANTIYEPRITQPLSVARHLFAPGATSGRSVIGIGDLVLQNADGLLDALATDYAFDGRALVIRRGTEGAAYPAGFPVVFTGTMEQVEVNRDTVVVRCRDRAFELDAPLQVTLYDGDNVLPDGLEGTADDLKGKPKPLAYGVVQNATLPCVNTAKLIYQLNDGAVQSVDGVYDAGIALGGELFIAAGGGTPDDTFSASARGGAWAVSPAILAGSGTVTCSCLGPSGTVVLGRGTGVEYSTTGDVWTAATIDAGFTIRGIAYDGTTYVAVGDGGQIWTSTNLTAWTSRTSGFSTSNIRGVAFGGGTFLAVGALGKASTSPTGTTWTAETTTFGAGTINAVVYDGSQFVIAGATALLFTTPTGVTYTSRTSGVTGSAEIYALGFGGDLLVLGADTGQICTSADGATWTKRVSPFSSAETIYASAYGDAQWIVAGSNGLVAASGEGVAWTMVSSGYAAGAFEVRTLIYATGLGTAAYANATDLEDDVKAPAPSSFKTYSNAAGSYVRLGSAPYGTVTADLTVGATAADRTAAQIFADVLTEAGYTSADWVAGDLTTLDTADNSEIGLFLDTPTTIGDVLDALANTVGAAWWPRASDGDFRIAQLLAPTGTAALTITADDLVRPLAMLPPTDEGRGLPSYRTTLRYGRNWTVQGDGLAAGVSDARRAFLAAAYRETTDVDAAVQTAYLLAQDTVEDTLYAVEADAAAEAARRQTLRGVRRRRFEAVLALNDDTDGLDLNDVVELEHPRFGLTPAVKFRILGIEPNARDGIVRLILWGS